MKFVKCHPFNPGDKKSVPLERRLDGVKFTVHKFNSRPRPKRPLIVTNFSEFGCESIAVQYCIPRVLQGYQGAYTIVAGWYGREYLYRHLVDEYWEINEEYQWLREYSNAFSHRSLNLKKIERELSQFGGVYPSASLGSWVVGNSCPSCNHVWTGDDRCPKCSSPEIEKSLFSNISGNRRKMIPVPSPGFGATEKVQKYLGKKPVGVFARGRTCYGRNLPKEFYQKLLNYLRGRGYDPIWLGEKQSVLPCPDPTVTDFSRSDESRDLELTLALISGCEFTVQFWTASTRLAAMVGTPFILFESPDQIAGMGQEGYRLALTSDWDKKKLVISHYLNVLDNQEEGLSLLDRAVCEMGVGNWDHIYGLLEDEGVARQQVRGRILWT